MSCALRLLTIIVNSVRNEDDKWKHLSRQIVDVLLVHLQSYVTIVLFDAVSSVELRPIDPFVIAFRAFTNGLVPASNAGVSTFVHNLAGVSQRRTPSNLVAEQICNSAFRTFFPIEINRERVEPESPIKISNQSLLDIYSTQLTLFDVVSSVALRPIDLFVVAFRALVNRNVRYFYL
ncbi:unnamed protein product [Rotaria sp. Silwood2]|nr:unnamed protein product [Rotaria sp. Silwood2]